VEAAELVLGMADSPVDTTDAGAFRELLRQAKAGDRSALEQIIIRHERQVLMTAFRLLGQIEDAQNVSQEVFLKLYRHLGRFHEGREMGPWLYRVTVNVCRDMAKRQRKISFVALGDLAATVDTEADLAATERRQVVADGLKTLPEKERAAVVLRDIEGLSTGEVARILGSSETTLRSQISTARLKLKRFAERVMGRKP
jgi:RNA polymerase sigma-70 factor (ECF subfamily)